MHNQFNLFIKWLSFSGLLLLITACSSFLNLDDDSQPFFRTLRDSINRNEPLTLNKPATDLAVFTEKTVLLAQAEQVVTENKTPAVMPKQVAPAPTPVVDEQPRAPNAKMLFAPYIPSLREGEAPRKWQKKPTYDFPWITGAQPVRVNEETIVGFGDQMLGRLYAKVVFPEKSTDVTWVDVATPPAETASPTTDKKSRKSNVNKPIELTPVASSPAKKKTVIQCNAGAPCLDVARDILVEDAAAKGWEMMLNRRVSLHNSFQFAKGQRVVWIELTSNGGQEMEIEYTLLPIQSELQRR